MVVFWLRGTRRGLSLPAADATAVLYSNPLYRLATLQLLYRWVKPRMHTEHVNCFLHAYGSTVVVSVIQE